MSAQSQNWNIAVNTGVFAEGIIKYHLAKLNGGPFGEGRILLKKLSAVQEHKKKK